MMQALREVESNQLGDWLTSLDGWSSKFIDYHPPFVERMFRDHEGMRVSLHRIHPCDPATEQEDPSKALYHPHPWPGAFRVWGAYEMGMGRLSPEEAAAGVERPPITMTLWTAPGTLYEMVDPLGWHYVRPLGNVPCVSVMVTGQPWAEHQNANRTGNKPLRQLTKSEQARLLADVRRHY